MRELGIDIIEECRLLSDKELGIEPRITICGSPYNGDRDNDIRDSPCIKKDLNEAAFLKACIKEPKKNSTITLKFPSVGATENILLCAAFLGKNVKLNNAAREPEIVALQDFLNDIGAKICGAGSSCIYISPSAMGTDLDKEYYFKTPPDRIECGTYLIAGAICGGTLDFHNCSFADQSALLRILKKDILTNNENKSQSISFEPCPQISDLLVTSPYPGIPTDLQSPLSSFFCTVKGKNYIIESIFRNRTAHLSELLKMGAKIKQYKNCFIIEGQTRLTGCLVEAKDLRGGAALILAGLGAEGTTEVLDNNYITRGYSNIELKLTKLGADISKKLIP